MTPRTLALLAACVALAFFAGCEHRRADREAETRKAFEARAIDAERFNRRMDALRRTDSMASAHAHREANRLREEARFGIAAATIATHRLDSILATLPALPRQYEVVVRGYRFTIDSLTKEAAKLTKAAALDSLALDRERAAHRWTLMARDSLAATLAARPKPSGRWWARLVPRPYAGVGAVVTGGVVRAGPSLGVGWAVSF